MTEVIVLRALERSLALLIGALCIYLGYRLFLKIPAQRQGEAKIEFPGGLSIYLARVGPGVFFALFGSLVVAFGLYQEISFSSATFAPTPSAQSAGRTTLGQSQPPQDGTRIERYTGLTQAEAGLVSRGSALDEERLDRRMQIAFLNQLPVPADLSARGMHRARVTDIKLALMQPLWAADWGDRELFEIWAQAGADAPVPDGLAQAVDYFRFAQLR